MTGMLVAAAVTIVWLACRDRRIAAALHETRTALRRAVMERDQARDEADSGGWRDPT